MARLNRVLLIGNVGNDPEIRTLSNNEKVASFRLATTVRYKDRNGEVKEYTEWHQVTAWGKLADFVEKMVKKGSQVFIEGKITTRKWTDKDGNDRYTTEIWAEGLQVLGKLETTATRQEESPALKALKNNNKPNLFIPLLVNMVLRKYKQITIFGKQMSRYAKA